MCLYLSRFRLSRLVRSVFFSGRATPQALHSFPTRRSSDLSLLNRSFMPLLKERELRRSSYLRNIRVRSTSPNYEDRKSTRLNSSHEWISYAVFCLKKNNTNIVGALVTVDPSVKHPSGPQFL